MTENTEAGAIAALAAKASGAHVVKTDDNREFLIVPSGFSEKEVSDAYGLKLAKPKYIKQTVTIETADSLVDYVNRFKGADTMLFAEISSNRIVALVDYHGAGGGARRAPRQARIAVLRGMAALDQDQRQADGAARIRALPRRERRRRPAPDAGELLDACRDLQVRRKVNFTKAVRTASDNENFEYSEETNTTSKKGDLELPTKFKLGLPVYFGDAETECSPSCAGRWTKAR
jgi:hypothetical protein